MTSRQNTKVVVVAVALWKPGLPGWRQGEPEKFVVVSGHEAHERGEWHLHGGVVHFGESRHARVPVRCHNRHACRRKSVEWCWHHTCKCHRYVLWSKRGGEGQEVRTRFEGSSPRPYRRKKDVAGDIREARKGKGSRKGKAEVA